MNWDEEYSLQLWIGLPFILIVLGHSRFNLIVPEESLIAQSFTHKRNLVQMTDFRVMPCNGAQRRQPNTRCK